jgi:Poly(3-hydroxybutyrate) depolymerase
MNGFFVSTQVLILLMTGQYMNAQTKMQEYTTHLYDTNRERIIPIAIYSPPTENDSKVIIFNHGYGQNKGGDYKLYSHITRKLADEGYFVISIQHELPTDDLLAMEGNLYENRLPNWQRGVQNILFIIDEFKKIKPGLNWNALTIMGHSNGGDMAMLFAKTYPDTIAKAISLDNRRMPLPRTQKPQIYSLRGCDYPADEGVIPSEEEQKKSGIKIIYTENIKHSEMDDKASPEQSKTINEYILQFLEE